MSQDSWLSAAVLAASLAAAVSSQHCRVQFTAVTGLLCVQQPFVRTFSSIRAAAQCSELCSRELSCQAFTLDDGPCQLFVFNKGSKSVRNCSCSRRGQVFVKQQPGLQPGALCPSGYGDGLCGVKYRVHVANINWGQGRQICESDGGLVIMADVTDTTEMEHVEMLRSKYIGPSDSFLLGGIQAPGSPEPAGGWYWIGCNITIDSSLWNAVEPDNHGGRETVVGRFYSRTHLADFWELDVLQGAVCECVSPFD